MRCSTLFALAAAAGPNLAAAVCPVAHALGARQEGGSSSASAPSSSGSVSPDFLMPYEVDDSSGYLTSDVGGPIEDQTSLKAGLRGPTLLEDFKFRQKIQHFDHERVPERAVHARGTGAHGTFTSYGDWSNITAASFLAAEGKQTEVFVRFSTVAGERGSSDMARDVHGFATRFYTDEGNFDIVGNNIPVFFIQDAIQFPDLIHSVKPQADNAIPQAATAHDTAWDYFSSQPSTLHTLFWAMAGYGIPRGFRHVDGFGVHTFRLVTDAGDTKLIKWHWKTLQGKASLMWEEAQALSGKNSDFHRQDLWNAIEAGNGPSYELKVQIMDESDMQAFGFDLLDPTKFIPEEIVPLTTLGVMKLDRNPKNYFAETEQIMFQPGHIVRGIDFTEDTLLQGRIFSYLDTQLNRHGGPNFEQLPINQPRAIPVHNNNRDGAAQMRIPTNKYPYSPNSLNNNYPEQANQTVGRGFFTAPNRSVSGYLTTDMSPTMDDHWSQPRLFYNSLTPAEQQFLINAMRFETSKVVSPMVKQNVITQLNRISNDVARRVALALGMEAPAPDPTYYNDNRTAFVSIFNYSLPTAAGLQVGVLASTGSAASLAAAADLAAAFARGGIVATVVGEMLTTGANGSTGYTNETYSAADATLFDGVVVAAGAEGIFSAANPSNANATAAGASTLYPVGRPAQILTDAYRFGKPLGALGSASAALTSAGVPSTPGVYTGINDTDSFVSTFEEGLKTFKFVDRFPLDDF